MRVFFLLMALLLCAPAQAKETQVPQSRADLTFSFAPLVRKVAPAVVNIYARSHVQVQESTSPFMNDPFFRQFFGQGFQFGGVPREQVVSSLGSGVIVKDDGMIVTSHHVIKDAQEIRVVLADKREFSATVVLKDPQSDLAFLKIQAEGKLPYLELRDSDTLEVGDLVLAIGNPFGVGQTVTNGIVSGLARRAVGVSDYQFFIQTDAAINPGNSGGALVDMNGRLIGVNTAIYSTSGASHGIGFAIPANMIRSLLDSKVEEGRVVRPWLGVAVQPLTREITQSMGLADMQGVLVKKVYPDSPAQKGGLKVGDIILAVNGADIGSDADMQYRLTLAKIGAQSSFKLIRDAKPQTVEVTLTAPPEMKSDQRKLEGRHPLSGVTVATLSPAMAMELGLGDAQGVVVLAASSSNAGISIGFRPGDIILQVNGVKITTVEQLDALLKKSQHDWEVIYQRGGGMMTLRIRL